MRWSRKGEYLMKKFVIYLLTLMMIFSPMTAFAVEGDPVEEEGQVPVEELQDQDAEVTEEAAPAEDAEVVEEAAPAAEEEAVEEASAEDGVAVEEEQEVFLKAAADEEFVYGGNAEVFWVQGARTEARDKDGKKVRGLFKAERIVGKLGLYYADETGKVVAQEGLITPTNGNQFIYTKIDNETGWNVTGGGPYTYLMKNHNGDFYITNVENGLETAAGKKYHIKDGRVETTTGAFDFEGSKYYVLSDYSIQTTVGFTPDHKYFVNDAEGRLRTDLGTFQYNGKFYYTMAGGEVPSVAGLYSVGNTQFYVNSDGSVKTDAGFINVNGRKYFVNAGGAISKLSGIVTFGGKKYVAEPGGAIHTTVGFYKYGANVYYVTNTDGVLKVNQAFKVSGKTYHALPTGAIAVGVHKWTNGKYYYSVSSGALRKKAGIVTWYGNRYHVNKKGKVTTNKKVKYKKKYYVAGKNGAIYRGLFIWKKNMYYANSKGVLRTKAGAFTYNGARYATNSSGKVYRDTKFTAGGKTYIAQKDGKLRTGHIKYNNKYYLTDSKGAVITKAGIYGYNKKSYYVKKGGALLVSDFFEYKDKYYYAGSDGAILKTTFKAKGYTWHPNSKTGEISVDEYSRIDSSVAPKKEENPA